MKLWDIVEYEGDNSTFVWKHPCEDFNLFTQLVVRESQEAMFYANGQALDLFGPGRHTLKTANIPLLRRLVNIPTDGEAPFKCEVYFINKTVQMAIKWGTSDKVRFIEPSMGIPMEIGAYGEMNLAVSDARKLLVKMVGTMNGIAWESGQSGFTKSIHDSFRPLISTAIKSHLAAAIKAQNINILDIDENLESLSETLRQQIVPGFEEYGLTIPQFYITGVSLPENDPNFRRFRDLHTVSLQTRMIQEEAHVKTIAAEADATVAAAQRQAVLERQTTDTEIAKREAERYLIQKQAEAQANRMAGMAEADVMAAKGYTQRDVLAADVQKAYAEGIGNMTINGSGGGVAGDMIGLGVGMAAAGAVAPQLGEMFKGFSQPAANDPAAAPAPQETCAKCGAKLPANAKFCFECGEKVVPAAPEGMIVCPECGKTVAKGKFCLECGYKFITACPKCNAEIPTGAKFCLECGEKL